MPRADRGEEPQTDDDVFAALWRDAPKDQEAVSLLSSLPAAPRWRRALVVVAGIAFIVAAIAVLSIAARGGDGHETTGTAVVTSAPDPESPALRAAEAEDASLNPAPTGGLPLSERVDPRWVAHVARATGIPERAMTAYAGAVVAVADDHPSCGLGWNTLAAIGLVESDHGAFGGSRLGDDGAVTPAIIGIALDGNGAASIPDTDGGHLDGDPVWDRAVGPMQFIPSTWAIYAQDGDGDGDRDPNQIDDAALAAAVYLCDVGGDLTVPGNWIAAVADYNPSVDYNHRVADAANMYAQYG